MAEHWLEHSNEETAKINVSIDFLGQVFQLSLGNDVRTMRKGEEEGNSVLFTFQSSCSGEIICSLRSSIKTEIMKGHQSKKDKKESCALLPTGLNMCCKHNIIDWVYTAKDALEERNERTTANQVHPPPPFLWLFTKSIGFGEDLFFFFGGGGWLRADISSFYLMEVIFAEKKDLANITLPRSTTEYIGRHRCWK